MISSQLLENIKELIALDKLGEALKLALNYDHTDKIEFIKISNRLESLKKKHVKGVISNDDYNIEKNRIIDSFLVQLEKSKNAPPSNHKGLFKWLIMGFILILVMIIYIIYAQDTLKENYESPNNITVAQVEVELLEALRIFMFREIVEKSYKKDEKYILLKSDEDTNDFGAESKYNLIKVVLNPAFSTSPISEFKYYFFPSQNREVPLYATVKDEIMLKIIPFSVKDSLVINVPELKNLDIVKDTIILNGFSTGYSIEKYNQDLGGLYFEYRFNKKGQLKEFIYEYALH